MMKKSVLKIFSLILSTSLIASFASVFAACGDGENPDDKDKEPVTPAHTHTYADNWSYDETDHWKAATCEHTTEIKDKAAHSMSGDKCTVCDYTVVREDLATCEIACPDCGKCIDEYCDADLVKCGNGLTAHTFEAEQAQLTAGTSGTAVGDVVIRTWDEPDGQTQFTCIGSMSRNVGAKATFKIDSDKATKATFRARVSKNNVYNLTDSLHVYVNGQKIDRGSGIDEMVGWRVMDWVNLGCIELIAGENTIVFECWNADDADSGNNIDKIELLTATDVSLAWGKTDPATCEVACPECGKCINENCTADTVKCGNGFKSNYFEAEESELVDGETDVKFNITNKNIDPSEEQVTYVQGCMGNYKGKLIFKITSDKACKATLRVRNAKNFAQSIFTEFVDITVNGGEPLERDSYVTKPAEGLHRKRDFDWTNLGCIDLIAGENTIVIEFWANDDESGYNMDKIDIMAGQDVKLTWNPTDNSNRVEG